MNVDRSAYSFRLATAKDLPRLRRWLDAPEVRRWWGDPNEQFELLRADLNEPLMTMRIVSLGERPFRLFARLRRALLAAASSLPFAEGIASD